jgi:hypothetical protein
MEEEFKSEDEELEIISPEQSHSRLVEPRSVEDIMETSYLTLFNECYCCTCSCLMFEMV